MSASNGLLAKGPKKPEVGNAKALFIDNSYIIADEFQFQQAKTAANKGLVLL